MGGGREKWNVTEMGEGERVGGDISRVQRTPRDKNLPPFRIEKANPSEVSAVKNKARHVDNTWFGNVTTDSIESQTRGPNIRNVAIMQRSGTSGGSRVQPWVWQVNVFHRRDYIYNIYLDTMFYNGRARG